jgi:hypothetical protein
MGRISPRAHPPGRKTVNSRALRTNDLAGCSIMGRCFRNSTRGQRLLAVWRGKGFIEIGQILWRQANIECGAVLANMLRPARLRYRAYAALAQHPSQRHLCRSRAETRRNRPECDMTQYTTLLDRRIGHHGNTAALAPGQKIELNARRSRL